MNRAQNNGSDQTVWMHMLFWVFIEYRYILVRIIMRRFNIFCHSSEHVMKEEL